MPRQRVSPDLFEEETGGGQGILGLLGSVISAHPSLAGGTVAFAVIFGFVASNALWHQPGRHPAPILKTRDVASSAAPAPSRQDRLATLIEGAPTRTVTTYRIERSDDTPTASIPVPNPPAPAVSVPAAAPVVSEAPPAPASDPVLARMQTILAEKGLYEGKIDGLMGPKSAAAIRAWERANGYAETGEPSAALLEAMNQSAAPAKPQQVAAVQPVAHPTPKPSIEPAVASDTRAGEPVTVPAVAAEGPSELVRQIQYGLSNIAYADIAVDGVAGAQTRAAISAFEKHYRLPVTGQPNETVLNKLLEIGAL